jgi:hypothetical protein
MGQEDVRMTISRNALPALVARMGGEVFIPQAEFDDLGRQYGGYDQIAVQASLKDGGLHLKLIRNPESLPKN